MQHDVRLFICDQCHRSAFDAACGRHRPARIGSLERGDCSTGEDDEAGVVQSRPPRLPGTEVAKTSSDRSRSRLVAVAECSIVVVVAELQHGSGSTWVAAQNLVADYRSSRRDRTRMQGERHNLDSADHSMGRVGSDSGEALGADACVYSAVAVAGYCPRGIGGGGGGWWKKKSPGPRAQLESDWGRAWRREAA